MVNPCFKCRFDMDTVDPDRIWPCCICKNSSCETCAATGEWARGYMKGVQDDDWICGDCLSKIVVALLVFEIDECGTPNVECSLIRNTLEAVDKAERLAIEKGFEQKEIWYEETLNILREDPALIDGNKWWIVCNESTKIWIMKKTIE